MASNDQNHPITGYITGGFPGGLLPPDRWESGQQHLRLAIDGMAKTANYPLVPKTHASSAVAQQSFDGCADPGTQCLFQPAYPGAMHGTILSNLAEFPQQGSIPGTQSVVALHTQQMAQNPSNQPLQHAEKNKGQRPGTREGGVKNKQAIQTAYIPDQVRANKPHWGQYNLSPWDQKQGISTAQSPFSSGLNMGMLANLPGMIMSLAQSFKGLSKQQKKAIQANTSPEVYSIIETAFENSKDVGDTETISIGSRVHKEEFANNLVQVLCECKNYTDVISAMHEMRSNTAKHGKDKLPTVEFPSQSSFGKTSIIIDAHGEITPNVSPEAAAAEQEFMDFLTQNVATHEVESVFYGEIAGNVMTVNIIAYGTIKYDGKCHVEGEGVTSNSYVIKSITGKGNTGTYLLSESSYTNFPNTELHLICTTPPKPENTAAGGSGGGGLGGLGGAMPGMNMFGDVSKLIGKSMPALHPQAQAKIKSVLKDIQGESIIQTLAHNSHHISDGLQIMKKLRGFI